MQTILDKDKKPSLIRLRLMKNGMLRIFNLERSLIEFIWPSQRMAFSEEGISLVIQHYASKLSQQDLLKLTQRLEALDAENQRDWSPTYNYIYGLSRN